MYNFEICGRSIKVLKVDTSEPIMTAEWLLSCMPTITHINVIGFNYRKVVHQVSPSAR